MPQYTPHNVAQQRADERQRMLGGQVVALRVDWAERLGSIHAALVLQQLNFEARHHADEEGWFFVTAEDMREHTAVGTKAYHSARAALVKLGLIETKRAGVPARTYIRLIDDDLHQWMFNVPEAPLPPDPSNLDSSKDQTGLEEGPNKNRRGTKLLRESRQEHTTRDMGDEPPPPDVQGSAVAIVSTWAEVCNGGQWPVNRAEAMKHARKMASGGVTPDEARSLIDWMRGDSFWQKAGIDLRKMAGQVDAWRASRTTTTAKRERLVF